MSWKDCRFCVDGICLFGKANMQGRENNRGHKGYRTPKVRTSGKGAMFMGMKRPPSDTGRDRGGKPDICDLAEKYASLWEFLVETEWEDGKRRQPGTLLIFSEEGLFKGMLNDKDAGRIAFCAGDTLEAILDVVDLGLRDMKLDWRKSKPFKK